MALFRRICQSLWLWNHKFHANAYCTYQDLIIKSNRKVFLQELIKSKADIYEKILNEDLSSRDWKTIRESFLQEDTITEITVDNIIMDFCLNRQNIHKAIMYFKFLRENNYPMNASIIGKYLQLYTFKLEELTDKDKKEIINTYEALRKMYPNLDWKTAQYCITSLCLTDQWEKTHEIIEMMKITMSPGTVVYSSLASAAFRHDKPAIAWDALSKISQRKLLPSDIVYDSHIQYCKQSGMKFDEKFEEMFSFLADNAITPYERVIKQYAEVAGLYGWSVTNTNIGKMGKCSKCSQNLLNIMISEENFKQLVESLKNKIIIGQHIYLKTNPRELQTFMHFIDRTKPFDVVIDGLNLSYIKKKYAGHQTLIRVLEYFSNVCGQKVLVLTRKHQKNQAIFDYIRKYAYFFLVDNISSDDVFILYATMISGNKAKFVSLDLMRQYKYLLNDIYLEQLFKNWQLSHQYFVNLNKSNQINIQEPFTFMPYVQKNGDNWHVPCIDDNLTSLDSHKFPNKWYCFKKEWQK